MGVCEPLLEVELLTLKRADLILETSSKDEVWEREVWSMEGAIVSEWS